MFTFQAVSVKIVTCHAVYSSFGVKNASLYPFVRPSARISADPTGCISVELDIRDFYYGRRKFFVLLPAT